MPSTPTTPAISSQMVAMPDPAVPSGLAKSTIGRRIQTPQHISLADRCDLALVAPCTMDMLSKLVHGRTDDVVTLILSAVNRKNTPVLLAPAMNDQMWNQPSNLRNVELAKQDRFLQVGPGVGWQACRHTGTGRMSEPEDICRAICEAMS